MNQEYKDQEDRRYNPNINASMKALFFMRAKRLEDAKEKVTAALSSLGSLAVSNGYDDFADYDRNYAEIMSSLRTVERKIDSERDFVKRATETYYNNMAASHWGKNVGEIDAILKLAVEEEQQES